MEDVQWMNRTWHQSEYWHRGRKILIMSKENCGMKAHVFLLNSEKVDFTLRFSWIKPGQLLNKAINKINTKYPELNP
jgi:hypothetical protein